VIEKFNLFLLMIADADAVKGRRAALERLSGPVGRYEGLALILVGLPLIVAAAIRFIQVRRLLADQETHDVGGYGPDLVLSGVLALAIAAYSIYLLQSGGPGMSALAPLLGAKRSSGQPTENDATDP
jgi:hypothetical protein